MRTYGRVVVGQGADGLPIKEWRVVTTDANGFNDMVWLTTLCQTLKLNLGESPFWSNYGIPARQSVLQQLAPDFNVALTQIQFAPYFAALVIAKEPLPTPHYDINVVTHQGVKLNQKVPIPQ